VKETPEDLRRLQELLDRSVEPEVLYTFARHLERFPE
jgi:hypothetical protein